jgi:Mn2+/Fe2+ NRAMP family transporter
VAVATIAGLAGSAATALALVLPGPLWLWALGGILASTAVVLWGKYQAVERIAIAIAIALTGSAVIAAASVSPDLGALARGLVPQAAPGMRLADVLPWLGFLLSGAAGMIWYSYWLHAKGYALTGRVDGRPADFERLSDTDTQRLKGWLRQMTLDNTMAVAGTLVVTIAFLILGAELLRPQGLVPDEHRVAPVLGRLLGGVWGPAGYWFMILAVFVGFWDTILADQDGFGRMFAHGARLLGGRHGYLQDDRMRRPLIWGLLALAPAALFLSVGQPVALLQVAGGVEAAHIPVVAGLTLYLNRRRLPAAFRPSRAAVIGMGLAIAFFTAFAVAYLVQPPPTPPQTQAGDSLDIR